jgi:hypothetical protein
MQSFLEKSFGELEFEILFVRRSSDMVKLLNLMLEFDAAWARQFCHGRRHIGIAIGGQFLRPGGRPLGN